MSFVRKRCINLCEALWERLGSVSYWVQMFVNHCRPSGEDIFSEKMGFSKVLR